ncbi:unnamed protein product, partial [Meganyctiphanes norvegica]
MKVVNTLTIMGERVIARVVGEEPPPDTGPEYDQVLAQETEANKQQLQPLSLPQQEGGEEDRETDEQLLQAVGAEDTVPSTSPFTSPVATLRRRRRDSQVAAQAVYRRIRSWVLDDQELTMFKGAIAVKKV